MDTKTPPQITPELTDADARLIAAAAPDMLTMLRAVLMRFDLEVEEQPNRTFPGRAMRGDLRKLIAQATGTEVTDPTATLTCLKRAWIRNDEPPGHSALGHISCPCGQAPESRCDPDQPNIACPCGTLYRWDGFILNA
jgi:hypothetical protein